MQEPPTQYGREHLSQPGSTGRRRVASPSSSRMFASYLTDVERLLDEHRSEVALREALDLPRLAVALGDPRLRASAEQVTRWCGEWIRPPGAQQDAQGVDYERLARHVSERASELAGAEPVPMRALRRLQLRRHVRMPPRGFVSENRIYLTAREAETAEICGAVLEAAARWYARSACHDSVAQNNLSRLAVLR
jgi:hypothetical protein